MEFVFEGKSIFDGRHLIFTAEQKGGLNTCKVEITFDRNLLQDMYDVQTPSNVVFCQKLCIPENSRAILKICG